MTRFFSRPKKTSTVRRPGYFAMDARFEELEAKLPLTGTVQGVVYVDANENGSIDSEESRAAGVRVHFDANSNGEVDQSEHSFSASGLPRDIPESGTTRVKLEVPETVGDYIVDVKVDLSVRNFFGDLLRVQLESPDGHRVTLVNNFDGELQDVTFDDEAPEGFQEGDRFDQITGSLRPTQALSAFQARAAAGTWTLIATQSNGFSEMEIEDWKLEFKTTDEPIVFTNARGEFEFEVAAGMSAVNVEPVSGFQATRTRFPVVAVDGLITPVTFPMTTAPNIISGRVFHDANADRVVDELEPKLSGWTIYVDANENGVLDEGELSTVTLADDLDTVGVDESGLYSLTLPESGSYDIRHVAPGNQSWTSYPLVNELTSYELYGSGFRFYRIRSSRTVQQIAINVSNIDEFDYSITDNVFYAITSDQQLGVFDLETNEFTTVGPFETSINERVSLTSIATLPSGELRGSNANGLYRISRETGVVELLYAPEPSILTFDYASDGAMYGVLVGNELWSLSPDTGEGIELLGNVQVSGGLDVAPDGRIYTTNGRTLTARSAVTGRIVEERELSESVHGGLAAAPNSFWESVRVSSTTTPENIDFAAYQTSTIEGRVEMDLAGERSGAADRRVYLDLDGNGEHTVNEPIVATLNDDPATEADETGVFVFERVTIGNYQVRQALHPTLDQTTPDEGGGIEVDVVVGEPATGLLFVNQLGPSFGGSVFLDANGNGSQDGTEPGLEGITVYLDADDDGELDDWEVSTTTSSDELGRFEFGPLTSKPYTVRQVVPEGWLQTSPDDGLLVDLRGELDASLKFGLVRGGTISGSVFSDVNADGDKGLFEQPLNGANVFLDLDGNSEWNNGEPRAIVRDGTYLFQTLVAGEYSVVVEAIEGYDVPVAQVVDVSLDSDALGIDFAAGPIGGAITGIKWWDTNEDGVRDTDELGLSGFAVYVDLNENGLHDQGEPTAITSTDNFLTLEDESGTYRIEGLPAGNYQVREVQQQHWQQTLPSVIQQQTTAGRMFAVDSNAGRILELNPENGQQIQSFEWPGNPSRFSGTQDLALGPKSLFYVADDSFTPTLWELDPDTGNVLDFDVLPRGDYVGVTYLDGSLYLVDDFRTVVIWDPETDTHVTMQNPQSSGQPGLASSSSTGFIYSRSSSGVDVRDPETFRTIARLLTPNSSRSIAFSDGSFYALENDTIVQYEAALGQVIGSTNTVSNRLSAIEVGDEFVKADFYTVEVSGGQVVADINFGARRESELELSGLVWLDADRNGVRSDDEAALEEIRIHVERIGAEVPPVVTRTIGDRRQTPNKDETGTYVVDLFPGTYRISIDEADWDVTRPVGASGQTAGFIYQLISVEDQLVIQLGSLAGGLPETIALPEQPRFVGPQGITVADDRIFYLDGSNIGLPKLWELDAVTGQVIRAVVPAVSTSSASGLASLGDSLFIAGDNRSIEQYGIDDLAHVKSLAIDLGSIGGIVADAVANSLIVAGMRGAQATLARVHLDDERVEYFNIASPVTGGLAIVNGELVADGEKPQELRRFGLSAFEPLAARPFPTSNISGLASPTSKGNSHYIQVTAEGAVSGFDFGIVPRDSSLHGDVNEDGQISKADAHRIRDAILADEPYNSLMDVNTDNKVDRFDVNEVVELLGALPGDVDLDGEIAFADFLILSGNFGERVQGGQLDGDLDLDGEVSFADFLVLSGTFGEKS